MLPPTYLSSPSLSLSLSLPPLPLPLRQTFLINPLPSCCLHHFSPHFLHWCHFLFLSSFPPTGSLLLFTLSPACSLPKPLNSALSFVLSVLFVFLSICHPSLFHYPACSLQFFCLWVLQQQTSAGEPLITAALTTIQGDMWRDKSCVPVLCVCVRVCACVWLDILMGRKCYQPTGLWRASLTLKARLRMIEKGRKPDYRMHLNTVNMIE